MVKESITHRMGYLPDTPDPRDYTMEHPEIKPFFDKICRKMSTTKGIELGRPFSTRLEDTINLKIKQVYERKYRKGCTTEGTQLWRPFPTRIEDIINLSSIGIHAIDLRKWCSPIDNQMQLGSCTANAGVGLIEFFEIKHYGKCIEGSRRFLYKVTRNLKHVVGDTGAELRDAMKAMVLFGVVPEEYWPYTDQPDFDDEPPAFCYAFANQYQALKYYRLDPPGTTGADLLKRIKLLLYFGLPSMFGMQISASFPEKDNTTGEIPFPVPGEDYNYEGHAMMIVGFDDSIKIRNPRPGSIETTGALLVRNSWGTDWGIQGYGWLPYKFVLDLIANDWWSLLKNEWCDLAVFE